MTTCGQCGDELPIGARFCPGCGTPQQVGCVACGAELPAGARFCPSCGSPQSGGTEGGMRSAPPADQAPRPVAQRRVTSVLFGDLVGFTTLAEGRDQEDVRELLSRYFETSRRIVERYGGVVEKFIGDAVMAVWGVPTANEDDAERAVRAGLELVAAVAGLREEVGIPSLDMRVGIVTGEVAVTLGAEGQGMVAGDAVNTAARVQSAATPGRVWVDGTTHTLAQRAIDFVEVGEHTLKGKAEPVRLWAVRAVVAGTGGSQRTDGLEAPLVGRDRELRLVKEIFDRTGEQGSPSLVIISGEPGVGKTRLAWEFEKYVDGLPATTMWHTGRCVAYGERGPYYALAEAIRARLRLTAQSRPAEATDPGEATDAAVALLRGDARGPGTTEDMGEILAVALSTLVPDEKERDWIAPRLGALLGVGSLGEFSRDDLFAAWTAFLRRVGTDAQSLVLQLDDAEHADEGLVGFVEHLMTSRFPVFVMMMARPGLLEEHPELARNPQAVLVNLAPLSDTDLQHLLDGLVAGLPASVREELASRSEGVPLYAVETVRSLIDRDIVVPLDGHYVLADREVDLTAIGAPASLQALVAARLDALSEWERRVVDSACVLGQTFHRDHLAAMVGRDRDLDEALARLERSQLVMRETSRWSGDFGQYRFVQAVVPQVAYGMLARRERRAAHLQAVEILAESRDPSGELAPVIAEHLTRAADAVPDESDVAELRSRALQYLSRAAERAEALGAIRECDAYLAAARDLTDDPVVRARLDLRRGVVLAAAYRSSAAIDLLRPLVRIFDDAGDEVAAGTAAGACGTCLGDTGRKEEAAELVETRWSALRDRPDAGDAVVQLASAMMSIHEGENTSAFAEAILQVGLRRGDGALITRGLRSLSYYYVYAGLRPIARLLYDECLRYDGASPLLRALNLGNLASLWMVDDLSVAAQFGSDSAALVDAHGFIGGMDVVLTNQANALMLLGRWDEALAVAARGSELDTSVNSAGLDLARAVICSARGEHVPAPDWSDTDLETGASWHRAYGLIQRTLRVRSEGSADPVAPAVRSFLEYRDIAGLSDDHAVMWPSLFDLARTDGDHDSMGALLDLIGDDELDRSIPVSFRAHRHRALGLRALDAGDTVAAVDHLRRSLAFYEEWKARPLAARTRGELGVALLRSRDEDGVAEGGQCVEDARDVLTSLRATAWLAELDAALDPVAAARD